MNNVVNIEQSIFNLARYATMGKEVAENPENSGPNVNIVNLAMGKEICSS